MTYLDAAYKVLSEAHQPLHSNEITRRALAQHLIQPSGLTPDATMASRLYMDTQEEDSRFVRVGKGVFDLARQRPGGIEEQVQQINRRTREQLHELLLSMPAKLFESLIMELLLKIGFDEGTLHVTPYSGDGGIDVVGVYKAAGLTEVSAAVQAKRWKGNVGAPTVTQLRGSLQVHQQGIIITTGGFSSGARKEAVAPGKTRIALINGPQLVDMLIKNKVGAIEKRLIVDALDEEWWGELLVPPAPPVQAPALPPDQPVLSIFDTPTSPVAQLTIDGDAKDTIVAGTNGSAEVKKTHDAPTGHKPIAVTVLGQRVPVKNWANLLVTVCTVLATQNSGTFVAEATATHGKKRAYVADSPAGMTAPKLIPGTLLYVETNLSALNTLRVCHLLLSQLGYTPSDLSVEYAVDGAS